MARRIVRRSEKAGLPPATLIPPAKTSGQPTHISMFDYDEEAFREMELRDLEKALPFRDLPTVTWVNIDGLGDTEVLQAIGEVFGLHPLVLEDILSIDKRPKMEDFGEYCSLF